MTGGETFLHDRLAALRDAGNLRELPGTRSGIDFWSNDYLGFSRLQNTGALPYTTAPGSRLISGDHDRVSELERRIASFHGFGSALLFGSGYVANTGLLSCIARRTDTIIYDELIHASTRDGIRLSGAAARRCQHNSLEQARALLSKVDRRNGQLFFLTEARFSMDGDTAPLADLASLCKEFGAHLIVDEAHSIGIDGRKGVGLVSALGLQQLVFASVVTYGKGLGCSGAAVLGSETLRNYLINFSRPFIFSTAPRPEQLRAIDNGYGLLTERQATTAAELNRVVDWYRESLTAIELEHQIIVNPGPIQLIPVDGSQAVMNLEAQLYEDGILVKGIRAPSVPAGQERLRLCLHSFNTKDEVDYLCERLVIHLGLKLA